jgi:hypothetical protein
MNASEIVNVINEVEAVAPVEQWTIEGVHVWPLIRIQLGMDLFAVGESKASKPERPSVWKTGIEFFSRYASCHMATWIDRCTGTANQENTDVLFLSDGVSFTVLDGKYYERFCDPLRSQLESLGLQSQMLTPLDRFYVPRFSTSRFIQPQLDWIRLKQKICWQNRSANEHLPGLNVALEKIRSLAPLAVPTLTNIRRDVSLVLAFSLYFEDLLERVRPQVCFLVSYYWLVGYGLVLSCKRKAVPSIDIQHGVQGPMHFAYGSWTKVPPYGYELLPTYFWCWTQRDADTVQEWSEATKGAHRCLVGGNLFLNFWKSNSSSLFRSCNNSVLEKAIALGADKQVLVTLQPGLLPEDFMQVLMSAIKSTVDSLHWWLRLHPLMLHERNKVKERFGQFANVDVDTATDVPLYALLRYMTVHVTHSSSTVLEAHEFGIKSVVCSRYGMELFSDQEKDGVVIYAETTEGLLAAIHTQREGRGSMEEAVAQGIEQVKASQRVLQQLLLDVIQVRDMKR